MLEADHRECIDGLDDLESQLEEARARHVALEEERDGCREELRRALEGAGEERDGPAADADAAAPDATGAAARIASLEGEAGELRAENKRLRRAVDNLRSSNAQEAREGPDFIENRSWRDLP